MSPLETAQDVQLSTPIEQLPGVRSQRARLFRRLGIETARDLIRHLPMRYEREWGEDAIGNLPMNAIGVARGTVVATRWVPPIGRRARSGSASRRGQGRFEVTLEDHRDRVLLSWFNAGYLREKLHPGMAIRVVGTTKTFRGYPQMVNPRWEILDDPQDTPRSGDRWRPIYPATEDLSSAAIERVIIQVLPTLLPQLADPLPEQFVIERAMVSLRDAFARAHQPASQDQADAARRRLAYNELLLLQLGIAMKRHYSQAELSAPPLRWSEAIDQHILARFPFQLTRSQRKVVSEITGDLQLARPMNRLLQGDVGSGKTVVALYAVLLAVANRKQGALMAPTELLAEQHHLSIDTMLEGSSVRLGLLTGGQSASGSAQRSALLDAIACGDVDIVIGTQALLSESVKFHDLAVVVTDEQHRFGVLQRAALRSTMSQTPARKGKTPAPHNLVMTATPIPRTLSLTIFGDLDISTIDGLPPGRTPITTRVVAPEKSEDVYRYLAKRLKKGDQAYVVVPAIDAAGFETTQQLKNVREHARFLADKHCGGYRVATIHGQLKRRTRESIMYRFHQGKIHVLVATTVIEVGVDVPNATVMIVEHAERFGLAQLHQLRGRIGRGSDGRSSVCVFIARPSTEESERRLEAIAATTDGFKIAEQDLQIRGMGDFFGTRQHGLPPLRVARIPDDLELLYLARRDATAIMREDPMLHHGSRKRLRKVLIQQYGDALGLIDVG